MDIYTVKALNKLAQCNIEDAEQLLETYNYDKGTNYIFLNKRVSYKSLDNKFHDMYANVEGK